MLRAHTVVLLLALVLAGPAHALGPFRVPPGQPGPRGREVDPKNGTGGLPWASGFTSPAAQVPFGTVQLGPDTAPLVGRGLPAFRTSGYAHGDRLLWGFSHTRFSGAGVAEGGLFRVVPRTGTVKDKHRRDGRKAVFTHAGERAHPGDYALALPLDGVLAELTATTHVGVHRYTFEKDEAAKLLVHATSHLGPKNHTTEAEVRIDPLAGEVEGSCRLFDDFSKRQGGVKAYFVARFDPPFTEWGTWQGGPLAPGGVHAAQAGRESLGAQVGWARTSSRRVVTLKLALSYVSVANARLNLATEAPPGVGFDAVRAQATATWEAWLGRVRVSGGTATQRALLATNLYRSLLHPTTFSDVNGEYRGFDGLVHVASGFTYYSNLSLWDTFRTQHPLLTLIAPEVQRDVVVSLVEMAKQGNGYLPRWAVASACTGSMFGSPAEIVVSETWQKGIRSFDVNAAYAAMRLGATTPAAPGGPARGREGVDEYVRAGYCPDDRVEKSVSRTLEYAWADGAIARLAAGLGHMADAALFAQRARSYERVFNPANLYMQPRDAGGVFVTPFVSGLMTYLDLTPGHRLTRAFVEGAPRHWRWSPFHDPAGLVALFPDRVTFAAELDAFFADSTPGVGALYPGPNYWHGNEHDIHAAYLFDWAGRPDLTQKWARWVLDAKYATGPRGLDGQDDLGTLSAWYVLSALGVYPLAGTDTYAIGSPLFDRADVDLGGGRALAVVADHQAPANVYVQSVTLGAAPHLVPWLSHAQLVGAGTLRFDLGPNPSSWGR